MFGGIRRGILLDYICIWNGSDNSSHKPSFKVRKCLSSGLKYQANIIKDVSLSVHIYIIENLFIVEITWLQWMTCMAEPIDTSEKLLQGLASKHHTLMRQILPILKWQSNHLQKWYFSIWAENQNTCVRFRFLQYFILFI